MKEVFSTVALKLVSEQPFKIPFIAAVVLYANAEGAEVAQNLIQRAQQQTQEALDAGKWRQFKLFLRFLACLSPLFEQDGVMPILDELFNRAADLQTASSEDVSEEMMLYGRGFTDFSSLLALSSSRSYCSPFRISSPAPRTLRCSKRCRSCWRRPRSSHRPRIHSKLLWIHTQLRQTRKRRP